MATESLLWQIAWNTKNLCEDRIRELQLSQRPPAGFSSYMEAELSCMANYENEIRNIFGINDIEIIDIVFMAISPVLAAWILAYISLFSIRWIKRGFNN